MSGDKLGEFRGKITGQRVLPAVEGRPALETSFEINGTLLGINATMMGTYWSTVRPDGTLYGECPQQGLLMTQDGEISTWSGTGAGRFTGRGSAVSFRGAVYFRTTARPVTPSLPPSIQTRPGICGRGVIASVGSGFSPFQ